MGFAVGFFGGQILVLRVEFSRLDFFGQYFLLFSLLFFFPLMVCVYVDNFYIFYTLFLLFFMII